MTVPFVTSQKDDFHNCVEWSKQKKRRKISVPSLDGLFTNRPQTHFANMNVSLMNGASRCLQEHLNWLNPFFSSFGRAVLMPRWETPTARRRWTLSTSSLRLKPAGRSNSCWGVGRTSAGLDRQFSNVHYHIKKNSDLECSAIVSAWKISQDVLSKYGNILVFDENWRNYLLEKDIQKMCHDREDGYNLRERLNLKVCSFCTTKKSFCISVCGVKLSSRLSPEM